MKIRLISIAAVLCCGWAWGLAAPTSDPTAAEVMERLRRSPLPGGAAAGRAALWEAALGPAPHATRCGTWLALVLRHGRATIPPGAGQAVDGFLRPPGATRRLLIADGIEVRSGSPLPAGLSDDGGDGVPDSLEWALERATGALRLWTERQGWLAPAEGALLRVVLEDLPPGVEGMSLPDQEPERTFEEDATAVILLSRQLLHDPQALERALTHQIAHAVLWAYSHREPPAWQEASAVALEVQARRDATPYLEVFSERLGRRSMSLRAETPRLAQGAGVWALFLDLSRSASEPVLRRVWEELAAVPGENLTEAMEQTLARADASGAGEEIAIFMAWSLFTGERNDGRHLPFASALGAAPPDSTHAEYPASGPTPRLELPPWSGSVVRLSTGGLPGGLRVQFHGEEQGRWSVLALFEERGSLHSSWVRLDGEGRGEIRFPSRSVQAVSLIVANVAPPASPAASFSYSAWHEAGYPFELAGLVAEAADGDVVLRWTTDGEHDMAGWNVYRSLAPLSGYARVNRLPIPAAGETGEPLEYVFSDSGVEPGAKYYYRLEALTSGGFSEATHSVSARTPRRPPMR